MEFTHNKEFAKAYQTLLKQYKRKIIKVMIYVASSFVIPTILFFILYDVKEIYKFLFLVSLGLFLVLWLMTLILNFVYISEKPYYEYLYPKVVDDINTSEPVLFLYQSFPKQKDFFYASNLYPTFSAKILNSKLSFESKYHYAIDVYDTLVYNPGQKSVSYLNGFYYVIKEYQAPIFQLRTLHSPYGRLKYNKLTDIDDLRAYVTPGQFDIDTKYIRLYTLIKEVFESPSVSISSTGDELHIGISLKPMTRRIRKFDETSFFKLRRMLMQIVDISNLIKPQDKK